jgi:hypothetical protein
VFLSLANKRQEGNTKVRKIFIGCSKSLLRFLDEGLRDINRISKLVLLMQKILQSLINEL